MAVAMVGSAPERSSAGARRIVANPLWDLTPTHGTSVVEDASKSGKTPPAAWPRSQKVTKNPLMRVHERDELENRAVKERAKRRGRRARAVLSLAAVFCLFASSLDACHKVVRHFLAPTALLGAPRNAYGDANLASVISLVARESERYAECVVRQYDGPQGCRARLNRTVERDLVAHQGAVSSLTASVAAARAAAEDHARSVKLLATVALSSGIEEVERCAGWALAAREAPSPPKVADAGNRTGGGQNDPGGPLARALEGFHEAVRALEGQVEARRRYDEDYLRRGVSMLAVEGSTPQILRSVPFLSSLETLGVKVAAEIDLSSEAIESRVEDLGSFLKLASSQYHQLRGELDAQIAVGESFALRVTRLARDTREFLDALQPVLGALGPLAPNLVGYPDVSSVAVPAPYVALSPASLVWSGNLSQLLDPDLPARVSASFQEEVGRLEEAAEAAAVGAAMELEASLRHLAEGYDPPAIDLGAHSAQLAGLAGALWRDSMGIVSGNISSRAEAASPLLATEGSSHLGRDFFSFDAEISDMRDALTTALGLLVAIDLAYRIFAALSTAAKYWSGANAAAPRMEIKGTGVASTRRRWSGALGAVVTGAATPTAFLSICAGLLAAGSALLYFPVLRDYQSGCIDSRGGTLISRNVFSLSMNVAVGRGKSAAILRGTVYSKEFEGSCMFAIAEWQDAKGQLVREYNRVQESFAAQADTARALQRCLLGETGAPASAQGQGGCETCNLSAILLDELEKQEGFRRISSDMDLDDPSRWRCMELERCDITCAGPNPEVMVSRTHNASCKVESHLHELIAEGMMTLCLFFFLNMGRSAIFAGFREVFCTTLSDGECECVLSLQSKTLHINHTELGRQRNEALARVSKNGQLRICFAVMLQIVWLSGAFFLQQQV